jgi:hypothetical protein
MHTVSLSNSPVYIYIYIYIYTHTHIHIHTCIYKSYAHRFFAQLSLELVKILLIVARAVRLNFTAADWASVVLLQPRHEALLVEAVATGHAKCNGSLFQRLVSVTSVRQPLHAGTGSHYTLEQGTVTRWNREPLHYLFQHDLAHSACHMRRRIPVPATPGTQCMLRRTHAAWCPP